MKSLKIGNIRLKNRMFLAPMVDVTDLAYRLICREQGVAIAYTEMLNIGSILHNTGNMKFPVHSTSHLPEVEGNQKTLNMLKTCKADKPIGIQITGNDVSEFKKVIPYLKKFDLVDINCGCPSRRIIGNQSGSYLLESPEKIGEMIKVLKKSEKIVTAKIRLGFKKNNVLKISKEIEKAGADALTVHARLASQKSGVPADWKWIKKVKNEIGIPVIGNGDVDSGESAEKMLDIADGVMIGRAAIGNPLIFKQISEYLKTGKEKEFDYRNRLKLFERYLKLAKKYDLVEMPRIKYLGGRFLRGFKGAAKARKEFMELGDFEDAVKFVREL